MQKQVDKMLTAGIIEESESPWDSPCLLIKKSGVNDYRFVSDLRKVNSLSKVTFWPLPTLDDILDAVVDNNPTIYSLIDNKSAFFQIKLTDSS